MFAQERQRMIIERIHQNGRVRVKDLSQEFDVTEDCIRKDLAVLEKEGQLMKTYGGAVSVKENPHRYRSSDRRTESNEERVAIATKAVSILEEEDTIYLDISLTSVEIAKQLIHFTHPLKVITNMIEVMNLLCLCPHITLLFIGGQLNNERDGFWGSLSSQMVRSFRIDKAFLGVVGIEVTQGQLTTYCIDDGIMKKTVIEQSQASYLLCEERKFTEYGSYVFASLHDVYGIVVAQELQPQHLSLRKEYGLYVL